MTRTDTFVDYYRVLNLPKTATVQEIEDAAKRELQRWTKATTHPNLAKRQEAEQKVKNISESRRVLLDPARRGAYDAMWATQAGQARGPELDGGGDRDWIGLTQQYLAVNDYLSASYAAREATQRHGDNAVTWSLRGEANYGLGRFTDALYEARQATDIEPQNSTYHYNLGQVQEALGQWPAAIASYEIVDRLEPAAPTGKLGVASVLLETDRPNEALRVTEELHRRFPSDKTVGVYHGWSLVGAAEEIPRIQGDGTYSVTSVDEIQRMRDLVHRARGSTDEGSVRDAIRNVEQYLDRMDQRTVDVPVGNPIGYGCFTVVAVLIGFSSLVSGSGGGFLFGLVCLAVAALLVFWAWVPRWKANARLHSGSGR